MMKLSGLNRLDLRIIAAVIVSVTVSRIFFLPLTTGTQSYPDFVAGAIPLADYYKTGDIRLFSFCFAVAIALTAAMTFRFKATFFESWRATASFAIPFFVTIPLLRGDTLSAAALLLLGIFWGALATEGILERLAQFTTITVGLVVLILVYALIAGADLVLYGKVIGLLVFLSSAVLFCFLGIFPRGVAVTLLWLQLLSPLLLLRFQSFVFSHRGIKYSLAISNPWLLWILIAALVLWGFIELRSATKFRLLRVVPTSLAAFMAFRAPWATPFFGDDYHLGELILPWHQSTFHSVDLYSQFVPTQGLLAWCQGALNQLLFKGEFQAIFCTFAIMTALFSLITTAAVALSTNSFIALLVAATCGLQSDRFYWFFAAVPILLIPRVWGSLAIFIPLSSILTLGAIFWQPASGVALAVPVAVICSVRLYRNPPASWQRWLISLAVPGLCALILLQSGLILFLLENGYTNTVAHGMPIFADLPLKRDFPQFLPDYFGNRVLWEGIRIGGWMVGVTVVVAAYFAARSRRVESSSQLGFLALVMAVVTAFLIPYTLGRVDPPEYLSRTGALSFAVLGVILPLVFGIAGKAGVNSAPFVFGALIAVPVSISGIRYNHLLTFPVWQVAVPDELQRVDWSRRGVGQIFVSPEKVEEVERLGRVLDRLLLPGESYFDLTNRGLNFYLLNRKVAQPYFPVVAANRKTQHRVIASLERDPPNVVYAGPELLLEFVPSALRSYLITRWFLVHGYKPVEIDGLLMLLSPARFASTGLSPAWSRLEKEWVKERLDSLPISWGKSLKTLSELGKREVIKFEVEPEDDHNKRIKSQSLRFAVPKSGGRIDYLILELDFNPKVDHRGLLELAWSGEAFNPEKKFSFFARRGKVVIPVGSNPLWLLDNITGLTIEGALPEGLSLRVRKIEGIQLSEG